tara:strand:- start:808 stop:2043 length:1236 start_codon:yes stop_codon:yes gene_type:complete
MKSTSERIQTKDGLQLIRMTDVEPKRIDWLWPGRIAKGKLTLIAGHPGLGKSQITASIAATVSSGVPWPDGQANSKPGEVLLLSAEDDIADTLAPRLIAAQADRHRVRVIQMVGKTNDGRGFDLDKDIERLMGVEADLLVIDPISAYLGRVDAHKNAEVRGLLGRLSEVAEASAMAIVAVSHLNKAEGLDVLSRVSGSMAFVAAARAAYIVGPDKENESRRLFLPMKNNLGPDQTGLAFHIEPFTVTEEIETSMVRWEPEPVNVSIEAMMAKTSADEQSALADAKEFLQQVLAHGPIPTKEVQSEAEAEGVAWITVRRAAKSLGVEKYKDGMNGPWYWALPSKVINDSEDAHVVRMSNFGADEHLRGNQGVLKQKIDELVSRHPKGLSNDDIAEILKVSVSEVDQMRRGHG